MKLSERMIDARLREITNIAENNFDSDQANQLQNLSLHGECYRRNTERKLNSSIWFS